MPNQVRGSRQQEMKFRTHGGKRDGAGRKPAVPGKRRVRHAVRSGPRLASLLSTRCRRQGATDAPLALRTLAIADDAEACGFAPAPRRRDLDPEIVDLG